MQIDSVLHDSISYSFIKSFTTICNILGVDVSQDWLRHEMGSAGLEIGFGALQGAGRKLGVISRPKRCQIGSLNGLPLPALAECTDGSCVVLLKAEGGPSSRLLVQMSDADRPAVWAQSESAQRLTGKLLLVTTRGKLTGASRSFDFSWFIPAIVRYRAPLRDVLIGSFFLQLMGLLSPIFFQLVIDKVVVHQRMSTLDVLAIGLAAVLVFETLLSGLRTWLLAHTSNRIDSELSVQLFRHLLSLPVAWFETRRVGDSVARVRELERIREFLTSNSLTLVLDLFFTIVFLSVMLLYSVKLTIVVGITLPLYVLISVAVTPALREKLDRKFRHGAENQGFLVEAVTGIGTLKALAVEPQTRMKWERQFAAYTSSSFDALKLANWGGHLVQLVSKITMVAVIYFGARSVIAGELSVGALVAFNMLAGRVAQPILRLSQVWQDFQQIRISVDRLGDVLNAPAEPQISSGTRLPRISGRIEFNRVRFRYRPDSSETLRGVDLTIEPGEMIGIVGPSGSGKSTLTKLIQRFYVPDQGRVLIDGIDISLVETAWLRRQIGIVLQENVLFNATVRENIALVNPAMPVEQVMAAARMAGAHEFILGLPLGYDTVIDERGGNLSGGQRQRIAIARALIVNPRILIFDEATSALDAESEEIVQQNLRGIAKGRTVIIVAHRLSAVRQCNRIVTVENGEITEIGTHDNLVRAGGRYANLYARQMGVAA